jgi:hypothetical protein
MCALAFVASFFPSGSRAAYLRFIGVDVFFVLGAVSAARAIWFFHISRERERGLTPS